MSEHQVPIHSSWLSWRSLALGLLAGLLLGRLQCSSPATSLPPDLDQGALLEALLFPGEKAMLAGGGIRVERRTGDWALLFMGEQDHQGRWMNLATLRGFSLLPPAPQ